jgi:hypothetical protein
MIPVQCFSDNAAVRWSQDGTINITRSHSADATVSQSEEKPLLDGGEQTTDDENAEQFSVKVCFKIWDRYVYIRECSHSRLFCLNHLMCG